MEGEVTSALTLGPAAARRPSNERNGRIMKSNFSNLHGWVLFITLNCLCLRVYGNPVPGPEGLVFGFYFLSIVTICFIVEVSVLAACFKIFHDVDITKPLVITLFLLNILSFFLILHPLYSITKSAVVSEIGVLLVETLGLKLILAFSGVGASWRRSFAYSLVANSFSILISLGAKS